MSGRESQGRACRGLGRDAGGSIRWVQRGRGGHLWPRALPGRPGREGGFRDLTGARGLGVGNLRAQTVGRSRGTEGRWTVGSLAFILRAAGAPGRAERDV